MNKTELSTNNGIFMDLRNGNITWNGQIPYCVITIDNGQIKTHYLGSKCNFCIILNLDDKKAVILNKEFENSTFTKLSIEKRKSPFFEQIYEKGNIAVWKSIN